MRWLIPNWDYLDWFDIRRAKDWQTVVWAGVFLTTLAVALTACYLTTH